MYLNDLLKQIVVTLLAHKIRSCLALFGIVWGSVTVFLLLALSNGFYTTQIKKLAFLNNATIFAWPGITSKPFAGMPQGQNIHIELNDFLRIVHNIPGIKTFSPAFHHESTLQYQDKNVAGNVQAVASGYQEIQQVSLLPGSRFIDPIDILHKNRVVFLDNSVKTILFGKENAFGKKVSIDGLPFTVIGTTDPDHASAIKWMDNSIYVPYTTYLAIHGKQDVAMMFLLPYNAKEAPRIKQDFIHLLAAKYHFDPTDDDAIHMPNLESPQQFITWFFRVVAFFLGACGALTLSVGGLGVANMMFLIVTERTREIGLRMALGARQIDILLQFLCETFLLITLGGVLGFIVSKSLLALINTIGIPEWLGTPYISWTTILTTSLILSGVGLLAGYYPARRAANMKPIQALAF